MDNSQDFTSDRAVSAHQDSTDRALLARTPNEDLQTEVFPSCSYSLPRDEHHRQVFAEELRKQLRVTFSTQEPAPQSTEPAPTVPGLTQAYDSHFHLDRTHRDLFGTSVIQTTSIEDVLHDTQQVLPNFQVEVVGGVKVFCDPYTFGNIPLMDNRWKIAIGLHPCKVGQLTDGHFTTIQTLLSNPLIKALGEIGLDRTEPQHTWLAQDIAFRKMQTLCRLEKFLFFMLGGLPTNIHLTFFCRLSIW